MRGSQDRINESQQQGDNESTTGRSNPRKIIGQTHNGAGNANRMGRCPSKTPLLSPQSIVNQRPLNLDYQVDNQNQMVDYNSNSPAKDSVDCGCVTNAPSCDTGKQSNRLLDNIAFGSMSSQMTWSANPDEVSDYQWFNDFKMKESRRQPSSILHNDFNYDISRNIDVNLAEIDMDDFHSEDINSILALPPIYGGHSGSFTSPRSGEQYADLTLSIMDKIESLASSLSAKTASSNEVDMKPVNRLLVNASAYSMDSLNASAFDDKKFDCQTNKNNYTIAFEGSIYSNMSDSHFVAKDGNTTWTKIKVKSDVMRKADDLLLNSVNSMSASLPNFGRVASKGDSPMFNSVYSDVTDFMNANERLRVIPVYRLAKKFRNSGSFKSSVSSDRSLMKTFLNNKYGGEARQQNWILSRSDLSGFSDGGEGGREQNILDLVSPVNVREEAAEVGETGGRKNSFEHKSKVRNSSNIKVKKSISFNSTLLPSSKVNTTIQEVDEEDSTQAQCQTSNPPKFTLPPFTKPKSGDKNFAHGTQTAKLVKELTADSLKESDYQMVKRSATVGDYIGSTVDSSGYMSSLNSLDRIRRLNNAAQSDSSLPILQKRSQVTMITTKSFGTQYPIQVLDESIQTSMFCDDYGRNVKLPPINPTKHRSKSEGRSCLQPYNDDDGRNDKRESLYVCYPNYSLPDLSFIHGKNVSVHTMSTVKSLKPVGSVRPKSCTDTEMLKNNNLVHIRDWDSLNVLLPQEYRDILAKNLDLSSKGTSDTSGVGTASRNSQESNLSITPTPSKAENTLSPTSKKRSMIPTIKGGGAVGVGAVPKPSKGILRKPHGSKNQLAPGQQAANKRYSMPEFPTNEKARSKRLSMQEMLEKSGGGGGASQKGRGKVSGSLEDLVKLQRELEMDIIAAQKLYSRAMEGSQASMDLDELLKRLPTSNKTVHYPLPLRVPINAWASQLSSASLNSSQKILLNEVNSAVDVLVDHFGGCKESHEKLVLGSSTHTPASGHKVLQHLCPTLRALVTEGLKPTVYTFFGPINNCVWTVVEATAQTGPFTQAMSDLIIRVNSEQCLNETTMKFNAFVFGLLNIRSLGTWLANFGNCDKLREKYYEEDSILSLRNALANQYFDNLLRILQPLSLLPFDIDLLFEHRLLHPSSHAGSMVRPWTAQGLAKNPPVPTEEEKHELDECFTEKPFKNGGKVQKDSQNQKLVIQSRARVEKLNYRIKVMKENGDEKKDTEKEKVKFALDEFYTVLGEKNGSVEARAPPVRPNTLPKTRNNFKQLKQHWEVISSKTPSPTTPIKTPLMEFKPFMDNSSPGSNPTRSKIPRPVSGGNPKCGFPDVILSATEKRDDVKVGSPVRQSPGSPCTTQKVIRKAALAVTNQKMRNSPSGEFKGRKDPSPTGQITSPSYTRPVSPKLHSKLNNFFGRKNTK